MPHVDDREHQVDEGQPLSLDEDRTKAIFGTVKLVDVAVSHGSIDTAWHPELAAGMKCPLCREHPLKRHKSTLYCASCKQRWWSRRLH